MMRSRPRESKTRTIWLRSESTFLMRWASSMTMYSHENFLNVAFSRRHISYDVMQTSNLDVKSLSVMRSA